MILYISYEKRSYPLAFSVNSQRRIQAMRKAGHTIVIHYSQTNTIFSRIASLLRSLKSIDIIIIRIDGSGILDSYTLLKLLKPTVRVIWEVHGFPEENLSNTPTAIEQKKSNRINRVRRYLSHLVDSHIFISKELHEFAEEKISISNYMIIPNFVLMEDFPKKNKSKLHKRDGRFTVAWGGNARLPWQAVDILEKVAKSVYAKDPTILFTIMGTESWHSFTWEKNILQLGACQTPVFRDELARSDICVALYHKPLRIPFYFSPLKILEYMMAKKPIIASNFPTIASLIRNNSNGILTDNSIDHISTTILRLKKDKVLRVQLGRDAYKTVRDRFTLHQVIPMYKKLFENI